MHKPLLFVITGRKIEIPSINWKKPQFIMIKLLVLTWMIIKMFLVLTFPFKNMMPEHNYCKHI